MAAPPNAPSKVPVFSLGPGPIPSGLPAHPARMAPATATAANLNADILDPPKETVNPPSARSRYREAKIGAKLRRGNRQPLIGPATPTRRAARRAAPSRALVHHHRARRAQARSRGPG